MKERVASVVMPSFRVGFDRAESFKNGALVLRGDDRVIGLEILQQRLSDALDGRPRKARPFTPHVTLLRDGYRVPEQRIEPIEWTVRELVLVHSLIGRTNASRISRAGHCGMPEAKRRAGDRAREARELRSACLR